ncbi:hypothetical protein D3C86_1987470 [compost metagenome]
MGLEQTERAGIDLGEQTQLGQVTADQGEVVIVIQLAQPAHSLHCVLVTDLTTHGVGRIGRVDHHPALANDFYSLFDQARLRVFRMNLEKLTHVLYLFRRRQ